jgi:tetratricopeptide (TPR) repeat protein
MSSPPAMLRHRVEGAVQEGRFQHALELGKQLYKHEPIPANRELLQTIYLGRAAQLRKQGYTRDAQAVLENAIQLGAGETAWLEKIALELAALGQAERALQVLARVPGSQAEGRVLALAADAALQQGPAGRKQLPESLRGHFDVILQASRQVEAGQDDAARETLQGIGLQSPFLEWRVFLRGLMAYYQRDDLKALENWQRLNLDRLPARLAAPLRFQIDLAFRQAQPPEAQAVLQKQADRLMDANLVVQLRGLQGVLADADRLPEVFRLATNLLPALRQQAPALTPHLAACFFWAIVEHGQPEDVGRYQRVFGTPADDPGLDRLRALLFEHLGELDQAHHHWQRFEQAVASKPAAWPGEQANRVRALVWIRMGRNAESIPDKEKLKALPPFLRDHPDLPQALSPSAEQCFQLALELKPDQLEPHEALFQYHLHQQKDGKAEKVGRRLLEQFPEHGPTLEALADIRARRGDYAEALELIQRALRVNPLNRELRARVGMMHLFSARAHAEAGRFEEARVEYARALAYREGQNQASVYCKWAACEFKAGDTARAEEFLAKALAESGNRLAVAFDMLIETIRLKLPRTLKTRFDQEFKTGLAEPPTAESAVALATTAAAHRLAGVTYLGQKTHEKQVLSYVDKALKEPFTEPQLVRLCTDLLALKASRLLTKAASLGQRRFRKAPFFYVIEAQGYVARGPANCPWWKVQPLLAKARKLALAAPSDPKSKEMLETIADLEQVVGASNVFNNPLFLEAFESMLDEFESEGEAEV